MAVLDLIDDGEELARDKTGKKILFNLGGYDLILAAMIYASFVHFPVNRGKCRIVLHAAFVGAAVLCLQADLGGPVQRWIYFLSVYQGAIQTFLAP